MVTFATRHVILLPFPFSDLSANKLRPALLLAPSEKGDWILCQITSNPYADQGAVLLAEQDFSEGGLQRDSYARPNKLFTAHETLFQRAVGQLGALRHAQVLSVIVELLRAGE